MEADRRQGSSSPRLSPFLQYAIPTARSPVSRNCSRMPQATHFGSKLLEYWRIFNKRKWLILSIAAAFVALAAVRTLMQTPLYTATVRLQIDQNVAKIVQGDNVMPTEDSDDAFMRTQYELLQGRTMAERVASSLKLGEDPDFLKPREFSLVRTLGQMLSAPSPGDKAADDGCPRKCRGRHRFRECRGPADRRLALG